MDDLSWVVTFGRVVQAGSFTAGAERLGLTSSVASKHVAKLEQKLGTRLLQRSTRKLSLTEAGAAYYEHCRRILEELEQSQQAVQSLQAEPSGKLRISTLISFANHVLVPLLPEFFKRYPKVELEIVAADRNVDLAEEAFDMALRFTSAPSPLLVAKAMAPIHFLVCAAPSYLRKHGTPRTPEDLQGHNCLDYTFASTHGQWDFLHDGARVSAPVRGRFRMNSIEAMRQLALGGCGLALLPTYAAGDDLREGRLTALLPGYNGFNLASLYAVYLPNRYGSPKLRAFLEFLAGKIGKTPYWDKGLKLT